MATQDTGCTIVPYFRIHSGRSQEFRAVCERCVEQTRNEPECLYYGFSFNGDEAHCREGYKNGDAALAHIQSIGPLLAELLKNADLTRLEVHGPEKELSKLRGPLSDFKAQYFALEYGFRR
ncbi:MAG TPA: antibiotic biosynthesis monooxygenase [Terriglobia bacterium]|jgi:quinol monooxygenase YgiN